MNGAEPTRPLSPAELSHAFDRALGIETMQYTRPEPATAATAAPADFTASVLDINGLINLEDGAFVDAAYAVLLHRPPDEAGREHYLGALEAGSSRILILGQLRYSAEGREVAVSAPGLRRRFLLHRLYRLKGVGRLLRIATALVALPGLIRDSNRLAQDFGRLRADIAGMSRELQAARIESRKSETASSAALRRNAEENKGLFRASDARLARVLHQADDLARQLRETQEQLQVAQQQLQAARLDIEDVRRGTREEPWADPFVALSDLVGVQGEWIQRLDRAMHQPGGQPLAETLSHLMALVEEQAAQVEKLTQTVATEPWSDPLVTLSELYDVQAAKLQQLSSYAAAISGSGAASSAPGGAIEALRPDFAVLQATNDQAGIQDCRNMAIRALGIAERTQALARDQERRLSLILSDVRAGLARGMGAATDLRMAEHQAHLLDPLYLAFEDRFRGTRADIKQRQSVYIDLLKQAGAGAVSRPIVDVGCGRGELLELLTENGLAAHGVDLNDSMVASCVDAGLPCTQGDAVAYLSALEPGSLGAVTGFHIIEHLPFGVMVALFDASLRALAPGGVVVFETPNPANLIVASRWFHLDPTHRNPLPAEMVSMIAEARGFVDVSIRELHPMNLRFEAQDAVLATQLDAIFHGPQDYALIAHKA